MLVGSPKPSDCRHYTYLEEEPDLIFLVEGIEFPCHAKLLSDKCRVLHDIAFSRRFDERLSKRLKSSHNTGMSTEEYTKPAKTIIELYTIKPRIFLAMLEFLYTGELPDELYCGDQLCDEPNTNQQSQDQTLDTPMKFLQQLLIVADRFLMIPLKHAIEYKLYDEFLYSFTASELFVWADSHSCAFLKEKAMDRICKKNAFVVDDIIASNDGWSKIRQSKRLLEELVLYAKYSSRGIACQNANAPDHKAIEGYFYKVEYLRFRLSQLRLDTDGTRKVLERRLRPHLEEGCRHYLPTKLTQI